MTDVKKLFAKNRLAVFSFRMICFVCIIALLADFIANEKPLIAGYKGTMYFPVLKSLSVKAGLSQYPKEFQNIIWKDMNYDFVIFPPVPYSPENLDYENSQSVSPFAKQNVKSFRWRHLLGTDELGRDVLSGMIHGTRIAVMVGIISMSIAALIGIFLGSIAGYFGDEKLTISRASLSMNVLFIFPALFYSCGVRWNQLADALGESVFHFIVQAFMSLIIFVFVLLVANLVSFPLKKNSFFRKKISLPVDIVVMRFIEVMISIPVIFLIISVVAIAKPSLYLVLALIGCTSWTSIAKYIRSELLRVRQMEYIESAHALGFSQMRVMFRHAIPNALSPVFVAIAFGVANAILIESGLSFLGIGVPAETITWGSLLAAARVSPSAWWLAVFPGFAIFATVTCCNLLGEGLTDALDPRLRK